MVIKNKQNQTLGSVQIKNGQVIFDGKYDSNFFNFVQENLKKGIEMFHDEIQNVNGQSVVTLSRVIVDPKNPNFELAFTLFLIRNGFLVYQTDSPVDEEIKSILKEYLADDPNKQKILDNLNQMSFLEKTATLKILKEIEYQSAL